MKLKIIKAGVQATLQDAGRAGWRRYGVARGGAMDEYARRVANIIVGNDEREAVIEITLGGFGARFENEALIALGGGEVEAMINDDACNAVWRPVFVERGSTLEVRRCVTGARVMLAVAGGFHLEPILDSHSAMLHADLDRLPARALRGDDELVLREMNRTNKRLLHSVKSTPKLIGDKAKMLSSSSSHIAATWRVSDKITPRYSYSPVLRVVRAREYELLNEASRAAFFDNEFYVTKQTDRTGSRLRAATMINLGEPDEMISEAVTHGTLQVTPNGELIALQAEHHTTGGYPRAAHVITVDLPLLGQIKAGDTVRFRETSIEQAHELLMARERAIAQVKHRVSLI